MFDKPIPSPGAAGHPLELAGAVATYAPLIARDARPIGFRLRVRTQPGASASTLLPHLLAGFEADDRTPFPHGLVVLALDNADIDAPLQEATLPRNVLLEVGQHLLDDEQQSRRLFDVQRHGTRLVLRVDAPDRLAHARVPLFQYIVANADHAIPPGDAALLAYAPDTRGETDALFARGANAVIGWPIRDAPIGEAATLQPQHKALLNLIREVQSDADIADVERAFKAEPVLAYLLLTLANSPAFLRGRPIGSLAQAIGVLGYNRLVKWLVLLMVISAKSGAPLPAIYRAVVRGFFLENLARAQGANSADADDAFIVGAFSLLDCIVQQSLAKLLTEVPLPPAIAEALLERRGPHAPALALACAQDEGDFSQVEAARSACGASHATGMTALLQALAATDAMQTLV